MYFCLLSASLHFCIHSGLKTLLGTLYMKVILSINKYIPNNFLYNDECISYMLRFLRKTYKLLDFINSTRSGKVSKRPNEAAALQCQCCLTYYELLLIYMKAALSFEPLYVGKVYYVENGQVFGGYSYFVN